jgi:uncharacterized protein YoxC
MNVNKVISLVSILLVALLAVAAFTLSYNALRELAGDNGIPSRLAWIWPLVVDGFLMVATLSVLRNSLNGEKSLYQWSLVALFTFASIGFNVLHADGGWLTMVVGAVPPVALALELAMGQLKSDVKRRNVSKTLAQLTEKRESLTQDVNALTEKRESLTQNVNELKQIVNGERELDDASNVNLGKLTDANVKRADDANDAINELLTFYARSPNATQAEAGEHVNRSRSWVSIRLGELEEQGQINRNGNGVEVLA